MTRQSRGVAPHETPTARQDVPTIDLDAAGETPILRQYREIKAQYPGAIVMARLGDFFELFGEDAETAAPILGLTLTGRGFGSAGRLPMCGMPHHAMHGHIPRLLEAGHSVVLWDQVGEVQSGKLVERAVTRVLSPGMVVESEYLDERTSQRCAALAGVGGEVAVAALDAAGGDIRLVVLDGALGDPRLLDECERLDIAELLVPDGIEVPERLAPRAVRHPLAPSLFDPERGRQRVTSALGVATLEGFDLGASAAAAAALGAVLAYAERARITISGDFLRITRQGAGSSMVLDAQTRRNLELVTPLAQGGRSLLRLLDRTRTAMGARLLRTRIQEPLTEPLLIGARLDSVTAVAAMPRQADVVRELLGAVRDLERLVGRCVQGIATPRDLAAVRATLRLLPQLRDSLAAMDCVEVRELLPALDTDDELAKLLERVLVDAPPATAREGGCVREGASAELDSLQAAAADARGFIAGLEESERTRTGIRSLKVGYNRVFGYYLEVPNTHVDAIPDDYIRKQTLVGAERYITPHLKEQEAIVLNARDRAVAIEVELIAQLRTQVAQQAQRLMRASAAVAVVDVTQSLALVAGELGWVRPLVDTSQVLDIEAGRHPLVEAALGPGRFVSNDTSLDATERVVILTGPNMSGKSTYLRQVALITLLAQIGSYVPATRARIGVCDRIFTRIGAHDDLAAGLSTFMVEMAETAAILRQATRRSLVILDEIGRGTSTYDGLSIARAIVEHIHDSPQLNCRTLFATHYHELTELADALPRVRNARVEVVEEGDTVAFLHRILPGGADRSYGIHVAKLAGLPASVVARSRQLLQDLETRRPIEASSAGPDQLDLLIEAPAHPVVEELATLDLDNITPIAALNKLAELRQRV